MKEKCLLIYTYSDNGSMTLSWHKTEADALESILSLYPNEWVIIGAGDYGNARESKHCPVVIRSSKKEVED